MQNNLGLYIHIPFCLRKCPYCDFYSVTEDDDKVRSRYADALLLHMEDYSQSVSTRIIDTIFIGGGTPTSLPRNTLLDIIDGIYKNFNVSDDAEITLEANPATITLADLKSYRRAGVNRLSIGLQSACENELRALQRIHSYDDFAESFRMARKARIDNINVDIMYGIPEQTEQSLMTTLNTVCDLDPEHISLYGLKIEENTPFASVADKLNLPNEDTEYSMYLHAIEYLRQRGYEQYEISNFAKPDVECRHNLKYWNCEEYLGLGAAAHSYFNGRRFSFKRDLAMYTETLENPDNGFAITGENYEIKASERIGEYVMLRMRLTEGVNTEVFAEKFGVSFERMYGKYIDLYTTNKFMQKKGSSYSFTTKGMYVSNYILSAMLNFNSDIIEGIADGTDK